MTKKYENSRGRQKIHSLACYDDTWNAFKKCRKKYGLTADLCLKNAIEDMMSLNQKNKKDTLDDMISHLQNKRAELE